MGGNDVQLQAVSESLPLKRQIFSSFSQILRPDAILASNTSSISITKIAAATVPEGQSSTTDMGKKAAGRVVG
jgi:3-hydroxybutyryl-CoA dehydrogenase